MRQEKKYLNSKNKYLRAQVYLNKSLKVRARLVYLCLLQLLTRITMGKRLEIKLRLPKMNVKKLLKDRIQISKVIAVILKQIYIQKLKRIFSLRVGGIVIDIKNK